MKFKSEIQEAENKKMHKDFTKLLSDFQFANQWPLGDAERISHYYLKQHANKEIRDWYDIIKEDMHLFNDFNSLYLTPEVAEELKEYANVLLDYVENHNELDRDVMGTLNPMIAFKQFCNDLILFVDKYPSKELQSIEQ